MSTDQQTITYAEMAALTGISVNTLRGWNANGEMRLQGRRIGRNLRFNRAEVRAYFLARLGIDIARGETAAVGILDRLDRVVANVARDLADISEIRAAIAKEAR